MKKIIFCFVIVSLLILASCGHNHEYSETVVEPTCENFGYTVHKCACGSEYTDTYTDALGHKFVDETEKPTCAENGYIHSRCTRCGKTTETVIQPEGHTFGEVETLLVKSDSGGYDYTEKGKCSACGQVEYKTKLHIGCGVGYNYNNSEIPQIQNYGGTVTAEKTEGGLYLEATPEGDFDFSRWSDGSGDAKRIYTGGDDLYAIFTYQSTTVPVLHIITDDGNIIGSRYNYSPCGVYLSGCDEKYQLVGNRAEIRVRGNASSGYGDEDFIKNNKVHYRLKFDNRTGMLGINDNAKCKNWVLLRGDGSFLSEIFSFYTFNSLTDGEYFSSDYTLCALYVNEKYMGTYIICDLVQIDKNRIDIDEKEDDDTELHTGYLIEIDNYASAEPYNFNVNYDHVYLTDVNGVKRRARSTGYSVKYDSMTSEQLDFVSDYIENVYRIVYEAIYNRKCYKFDENYKLVADTEAKTPFECIEKVFDVKSAAAMYITEEIAMDLDVGVGSFYMYVDFTEENPKLTFCAPWDFSWAYGNFYGMNYHEFRVSGFQSETFIDYAGDRSSVWFITLYRSEEFRTIVKNLWREKTEEGTFDFIFEELHRICIRYEEEFSRNSERWGLSGQRFYAENTMSWLKERIAWLDTHWGKD